MFRTAAIAIGLLYVLFSQDYIARGIRKRLKRVGFEVIGSLSERVLSTFA